ncbi:MAG: surface lipoprotein assembly modifier, partial [Haemophilus parainfluenzae]|nr:surface lipoprotein assembly modifier [Haemophilus parainfluenzae]
IRKDIIYNTSLNLWKRDWHLFGITPKINLSWKKQDSNLDTLYSYSELRKRSAVDFRKEFLITPLSAEKDRYLLI